MVAHTLDNRVTLGARERYAIDLLRIRLQLARIGFSDISSGRHSAKKETSLPGF
jgi:hypothetical protein